MKVTFPAWRRFLIWWSLKRHNDCGDGRHSFTWGPNTGSWLQCRRCPATFGKHE